MEDFKNYIIEYIEEYQKGSIEDIIRYLIEKEVIVQNLKELKDSIENLLKELTTNKKINYTPTNQKFVLLPKIDYDYYPKKNEFSSFQNLISGQFISLVDEKLRLNYEDLSNYLLQRLNPLGVFEISSVDNNKKILMALFESSLIQTHLSISNDLLLIKCQMKSIIKESEPIISFISNLNKSFKKVKCAYIPLNYGIYLIYNVIVDFIKDNNLNISLKIDFLEFKDKMEG